MMEWGFVTERMMEWGFVTEQKRKKSEPRDIDLLKFKIKDTPIVTQ